MSYDVGAHIDLSFLNKGGTADAVKKSVQAFQVEVGTRFIFRPGPAGLQAARLIPVVS